jgi:hypothetical protein
LPRIAGISSFGAGGANAHMIVEEYPASMSQTISAGPVVILLSARTPEQLEQKARDLVSFVRARLGSVDLASMAYTLQAGREPMDERLGFVVSSDGQLVEKLEAYLSGRQGIEGVYAGQAKRNREALSLFTTEADLQHTIEKWIAGGKVSKLLDLWVKGLDFDWSKLYGDVRPRRMSLPTYPFANERYWIEIPADDPPALNANAATFLHPLLHRNTSDLDQQSYSSTFTGEESFLNDADGRRILLPRLNLRWRASRWKTPRTFPGTRPSNCETWSGRNRSSSMGRRMFTSRYARRTLIASTTRSTVTTAYRRSSIARDTQFCVAVKMLRQISISNSSDGPCPLPLRRCPRCAGRSSSSGPSM